MNDRQEKGLWNLAFIWRVKPATMHVIEVLILVDHFYVVIFVY